MNDDKSSDCDYAAMLKSCRTTQLEGLLPMLLKELRTRDSNHMKGDAITTSRALRSLCSTGKIP